MSRAKTKPTRTTKRWGRVSASSPLLSPKAYADQVHELCAALSISRFLLRYALRIPEVCPDELTCESHRNSRINLILRLLALVGVSGSDPLNARFVLEPIGRNKVSLLEMLASNVWYPDRILRTLEKAVSLSRDAAKRTHDREVRLSALGYEDPRPGNRSGSKTGRRTGTVHTHHGKGR